MEYRVVKPDPGEGRHNCVKNKEKFKRLKSIAEIKNENQIHAPVPQYDGQIPFQTKRMSILLRKIHLLSDKL